MANRDFNPNFDPYRELGLNAEASPEVVRAAYRALARKHHPDNGAEPDAERMVRINRAHEILSNPVRRRAWDAEARRRRGTEAQSRRDAEAQRQRDAEAQRRRAAEAQRQRDAEAQHRRAAEAQRQRDAEAQSRRDAEAQRQRDAEAQRRSDAEAQRQRDAEAQRRSDAESQRQPPKLARLVPPWLVVVVSLVAIQLGAAGVQWIQNGGVGAIADVIQGAFSDDGLRSPTIVAICSVEPGENLAVSQCLQRGIVASRGTDNWISIRTQGVPTPTLSRWSIDGGAFLARWALPGALQRLSPGVHSLRVSVWKSDEWSGQWTGWSTLFRFPVRRRRARASRGCYDGRARGRE